MTERKKAVFYTPVVTVFEPGGELDREGNVEIYEHLIKGGIDGLVVMGSTGEFFSMTDRQKKDLVDLAVKTVNGRVRVIIGVSCMTAEDTVALGNYAIEHGADAVMAVSPYYFQLSDECLEHYFDCLANGIHGDVLLYNFPACTGHDLSPEVTRRLLRKHKNLVGYKDTVSGMDHTRRLLQAVKREFPGFQVFSGFDDNLAHNVLSGGSGCIGGLSNLYPGLFADWARAVNEGDMARCAAFQDKVDKLFELYSVGKLFVPVIKKAMTLRGLKLSDTCRSPLLPTTAEQTDKIRRIMDAVEAMS